MRATPKFVTVLFVVACTMASADSAFARARYLNPGMGRFMQRDSAGYVNGMNIYDYEANSPLHHVDPSGMVFTGPGADTFWNTWSRQQRRKWMTDFHAEYGSMISGSASANCVPQELLAAIVANEVIDWTIGESRIERWTALGSSVGPAQLTVETVSSNSLWTKDEDEEVQKIARWAGMNIDEVRRQKLNRPDFNIDMAGRLMSKYLKELCKGAMARQLSQSFLKDIAANPEDPAKTLCCPGNCDSIVGMDVPSGLISAMAAIWNNGPNVTGVGNAPKDAPNAYNHAINAGLLDGLLSPDWPRF